MGIDQDIVNWVLEFLLRQPLEDRTLDSLLRVLPLPDKKPSLKKLLLLKKLESEASCQSVSERILDLLEQLEEIEFQQGSESVSASMKWAYCAVAVECTVRVLAIGNDVEHGGDATESERRYKFFDGVKRVWRERIEAMDIGAKKEGLGSEELDIWRDEIEAAVWEDEALESIKKKREGINAVEAVNVYLREEREKLGPSFLELLADRVKNDEVSRVILGAGSVHQAPSASCIRDKDVEIQKEKVHHRRKLVGGKHYNLQGSRNSKGAKIVDSDEMATEPSCMNHNLQFAKIISGVARESKCEEPVEDNHVEAISGITRESGFLDPVKGNCDEANLFIVDDAGVVQATDSRNKLRPSLMDQNISAHTYEWDDSIDGSQDDPKNYRARLQLHSPRVINISPLRKHADNSGRRKRRKWSPLEEDTLRKAVEKYGKGNWKFILSIHHEIFQDRTDVDLKDKWRNLSPSRNVKFK